MRRSIKHLPKRTQEEIAILLELILKYLSNVEMVQLFGSYAHGNYVLWDQRVEFGVNTSYQSDLDILVVFSKGKGVILDDRIRKRIKPLYHERLSHRRHPMPRIIVEHVDFLNEKLDLSQYFFTEIINDGIRIYDTNKYKLAKTRDLSFAEIKQVAVDEFDTHFPYGKGFTKAGLMHYQDEDYVLSSFQLHQATEKFYNCISLVFTNYRPKCHKLNELAEMIREFSPDLQKLFPIETDFEKNCFDLLCRAYIEARYNKNFRVTKEECDYMFQEVNKLMEIADKICKEQIEYYDQKSKE